MFCKDKQFMLCSIIFLYFLCFKLNFCLHTVVGNVFFLCFQIIFVFLQSNSMNMIYNMKLFGFIGHLKTVCLSSVAILSFALPVPAQDISKSSAVGDVSPCRNGEVIVKFRSQGSMTRVRRAVAARHEQTDTPLSKALLSMGVSGAKPLVKSAASLTDSYGMDTGSDDGLGLERVCLLSFDTTRVATVEEAMAQLSQLDDVEMVEPNYLISIQPMGEAVEETPQAARISEQWGLKAMRLTELWQKPIINTRRPVIAIVDTGVDTTHPDLKDNIAEGGYDIVNDTTIITDYHGHGTHCAGVAAAAAGGQVCGANPNALIMPIIVIGKEGTGSMFDIMLGILKAVENGADIVSLSIGGSTTSNLYHDVIKKAASRAIIVAAAGNEGYCMHTTHRDLHGMAIPRYANIPGAYYEAIGVMATDQNGELAVWSNFDCDGPLCATNGRNWGYQLRVPGVNILSTLPDGKYGYMSGTSMATPFAAGAISRLLQCRNFDNRDMMLRALIMTTDGCIDVMRAYESNMATLFPGVFTENIDGTDYTFVQTSDSTAQMGNGVAAATTTGNMPAVVTVPNEVRGLSLTAIAPHAFQGCKDLREVRLGRCVEDIGDQAFVGCTNLRELAFATRFAPTCPSTAFDASHFKSVTLRNARGYAENFNTESPWKDFNSWKELELTTGNRFWEVIDNQSTTMTFLIYNKARGHLQVGDGERAVDSLYAGKLVIPAVVRGMEVKYICDEAFHNNNLLTEVTLPYTLASIWDNAFAGCSSITEVKLPKGVGYVGTKAFSGCKNMKTLTFSPVISTIGSQAFTECPSLESIYMPCPEPPAIEDNVFLTRVLYVDDGYDIDFGGEVYDKARLFVPYGRKAAYASAPGWKLFKHIEETWFDAIEDIPQKDSSTGVAYDLQGRKIKLHGGSAPTLKGGIYIIGGRKVKI